MTHFTPFRPDRAARRGSTLLVAAALLSFGTPTTATAQGFFGALKRAAKGASVVVAEVAMADATVIDLEGAPLGTVPVGSLVFGVARVEVKDSIGVRVHGYLYNPGAADVAVPPPPEELFTLTDDRGRTVRRVGGPRIEGVDRRTKQVTVRAGQRVAVRQLFDPLAPDAATAALSLGAHGTIAGLPVRQGAATTYAAGAPVAPSTSAPVPTPSTPSAPPAAGPAPANTAGTYGLANLWTFQTLTFQNADGSMQDASRDVGGSLHFFPNGQYRQSLRIGDFVNDTHGTYRVQGDKVYLDYQWNGHRTDVLTYSIKGVWLTLVNGSGRPGERTTYYGLQLSGSCDDRGNCATVRTRP